MSAPRWVPIGRGASLLLAPAGRRYAAECSRIAQSLGVRIDETNEEEITSQALVRVVLLDWRGVSLSGEEEEPYTEGRGLEALRRSPHFRELVLSGAQAQPEFDRALIEQTCEVLKWNLRWGASLETLYRHKERFKETPKALLERPEMLADQRSYLDSFHVLSNFRGSSGFGPSPLHYADVVNFATQLGYEPGTEALLFFVEMMAALDGAYLKLMNEKNNSASSAKKPVRPVTRKRP